MNDDDFEKKVLARKQDPALKEQARSARSSTGELEEHLEGEDLKNAMGLLLAWQQVCDEEGID